MPIQQLYYLDTATLSSATGIFVDEGLTTLAPDGFYSDTIITRQMLGGVLYPAQPCIGCYEECNQEFVDSSLNTGVFLININTGTNEGAILIRLDSALNPNGIKAVFNSQVYNKLSSDTDGVHQSTDPFGYTFTGDVSEDCGLSGSTYPTLPYYVMENGTFELQPTTQSLTVAPGDVSLSTVYHPAVMVIPKPTATASVLSLYIAGVCPGDRWNVFVTCPEALPPYGSSNPVETIDDTCDAPIVHQYYFASLTNIGSLALYDYVFTDSNGQFPVADGFYGTYKDFVYLGIQVQNGVIVDIINCDGCIGFWVCVNEGARNAIRFNYIDCDGAPQMRVIGAGGCACISTTVAGWLAMSIVWADGYIPNPTAGDYNVTINGCP